ncbi:hypothetical protein AMECASPLE_032804 [Ameca splendens]|uniref:Transposase Tc1-like domain-containing protein n=1 Tax=Ameca splendens TaxID=208324 RepID=A0ABV0YIQ0_9TELE
MSKVCPVSDFSSLVSCDLLVLPGFRCATGAGVLNLVLSLSSWSLEVQHGKELYDDLKIYIFVALHKADLGYKKIANTLKLSCSTVAKTIQRFNRTGQKLSAHAQPQTQRTIHRKAHNQFAEDRVRTWISGTMYCSLMGPR